MYQSISSIIKHQFAFLNDCTGEKQTINTQQIALTRTPHIHTRHNPSYNNPKTIEHSAASERQKERSRIKRRRKTYTPAIASDGKTTEKIANSENNKNSCKQTNSIKTIQLAFDINNKQGNTIQHFYYESLRSNKLFAKHVEYKNYGMWRWLGLFMVHGWRKSESTEK